MNIYTLTSKRGFQAFRSYGIPGRYFFAGRIPGPGEIIHIFQITLFEELYNTYIP